MTAPLPPDEQIDVPDSETPAKQASRAYLERLVHASAKELPPEELTRDYRRALMQKRPNLRLAQKILARLLDPDDQYGYLKGVKYKAATWKRDRAHLAADLVQDTAEEIIRALPTDRGAYAEENWHRFTFQCYVKCWRKRFGKKGQRLMEAADPPEEAESFDEFVTQETSPVNLWEVELPPQKLEEMKRVVREAVESIQDDFLRTVGLKLLFDNPPTVTALADELGVGRRKIYHALDKVRAKVFVALRRTRNLHGCDDEWLQDWLNQ